MGLQDFFSMKSGGSSTGIIPTGNNFTATTDPTAVNDNTQGFGLGSWWVNTAALRLWECIIATTGAAVWSFKGAAYGGGGSNPPTQATQLGSGAALIGARGYVSRQVFAPNVSPAALNADSVLAVYSVPMNSFDVAGRGVSINAQGGFAANGNTKTIKILWGCAAAVVGQAVSGGTVIASTGAVTTNGGGFTLSAEVYKYGVNGSNTQAAVSLQGPTPLTAPENAAILVAVTGNAATALTDILLALLTVSATN